MKVGQKFRFSEDYIKSSATMQGKEYNLSCELLDRQSLLECFEIKDNKPIFRHLYMNDSGEWAFGCWYQDLTDSDIELLPIINKG